MGLNKDESGRRWVQAEVEVPGTPEKVWKAIATGPGVSSWFVPTEVREDGTVVANFGPGMESVARVTSWEPPHRFSAESADLGPDAPAIATEWIVEAQSGDTCVVRVVHSLLASTDDWDDQLRSFEGGWPWFFHILRLYLANFAGQPHAAFRVIGAATEPVSEAWEGFFGCLGLGSPAVGQRFAAGDVAPALAGVADRLGDGGHSHGLIARLDAPGSGILSTFALPMGGQVLLIMDFYFYGEEAAALAAEAEPQWQSWFMEHFPPMGDPAPSSA